jgi:hypothetical protein
MAEIQHGPPPLAQRTPEEEEEEEQVPKPQALAAPAS